MKSKLVKMIQLMILTMPLILADYHMVTIKIQRDVELEMAGENHKRNW